MLRPLSKGNQFDYELLQLSCQDCGKRQLFLSLPGETSFVCDDCVGRRKKSGIKKEV
jgi:hypothetical protein